MRKLNLENLEDHDKQELTFSKNETGRTHDSSCLIDQSNSSSLVQKQDQTSLNQARQLISPESPEEFTFAANVTLNDETTDWDLLHDIAAGRPILSSFDEEDAEESKDAKYRLSF